MFKLGFIFLSFISFASAAFAAPVIFDTEERKAQLQTAAYAEAKKYCLAANVKWDGKLPSPISGLKTTDGYGSDNRPAKFTWYVMVLTGRSLAGDAKATNDLKEGLLSWSKEGAFLQSDTAHDTYYALKRYMLPVVIALSAVDSQLSSSERSQIVKWIDAIVPRLDKKFDGDVDDNNHRYLADSVLMAWGAYKKDARLINIGRQGFMRALADARADGSLPLETRRGARAVWYMRHALSSLVTIAEIDRLLGGNLYNATSNGNSLASLMNYFITASRAPLVVLEHAAENYIPGPHKDYLEQDTDYMRRRGHDRHYMAFAEPYILRNNLSSMRLDILMQQETKWRQRPYIDEYVGGNASCFYWKPRGTR